METAVCKKLFALNIYGDILLQEDLDDNSYIYFLPEKEYKIITKMHYEFGECWCVIKDERNENHLVLNADFEIIFYTVKNRREQKIKKLNEKFGYR